MPSRCRTRCAALTSNRGCSRHCGSIRWRSPTFAAGTGNPFFTTDTAAALRGREMGVDIVLKATKVDGVYTADPNKDASAQRYVELTFDEAIVKNLRVMDATALALCRDQNMLLKVFSINVPGALKRVVLGGDEGTLVNWCRRSRVERPASSVRKGSR